LRPPRAASRQGPPDPAAGERSRAFRRARMHSAIVRTLRIALPVCALATATLYLWPTGASIEVKGIRISAKKIDLAGDRLKMRDPQFDGFTDEDGRYNVRAKWATQDPSDKNVVDLEKIEASLTETDNDWAKLVSTEGTYWIKANRLRLKRNIAIETSAGLKAKLRTADFFVKEKRVVSSTPVEVTLPNGNVEADGLELLTQARNITFRKNVVAHLTPPPRPAGEGPAKAAANSPVTLGDGPIDVTSDLLEIVDAQKTALFTGNVRAVQTDSMLTAATLKVSYAGAPSSGGLDAAEGAAEVTQIEASENVELTMADGRKAKGDRSLYDRLAGTMTLVGNVAVSDGANLITGSRLEMDLEKRISRFPPLGRVKAHLASAEAADEGGAPKKKAKKAVSGKEAGGTPSIGESFTGFAANSSGATDIEANELEVREAAGEATFRGNVIAVRGDHEIRAQAIDVAFKPPGKAKTAPAGATGDVSRIKASGRVVVKAPDDQVSTSDWLVYDAQNESITIGGNVVVSQGKNVIKGEKLVVDLKTGQSHFETGSTAEAAGTGKQRVKMLIDRVKKTVKEVTSEEAAAGQ
jgi:lipopolysaccharide transport protein LptA